LVSLALPIGSAFVAEIKSSETALRFWRDAGPQKWFTADPAFDAECRTKFLGTYEIAASGGLLDWEATRDGRLALVIVLDQLPRNMFRGTPQAYATDALARAAADRALARHDDQALVIDERTFLYLPFTHSEDMADQQRGLALYRAFGDADGLKYAEIHADIIARFGRFPHRNGILGRPTTAAEQAFLEAGGFAG